MALYSTFRHTVQEVYLYTHCKCQRTKKKERKKNYELHMFYVLISLIFQLWVLELAVSQFFGHLNCVCASYTNRLKKKYSVHFPLFYLNCLCIWKRWKKNAPNIINRLFGIWRSPSFAFIPMWSCSMHSMVKRHNTFIIYAYTHSYKLREAIRI